MSCRESPCRGSLCYENRHHVASHHWTCREARPTVNRSDSRNRRDSRNRSLETKNFLREGVRSGAKMKTQRREASRNRTGETVVHYGLQMTEAVYVPQMDHWTEAIDRYSALSQAVSDQVPSATTAIDCCVRNAERQNEEEPPRRVAQLQCETGGDLLSQAVSDQVPSAQLDLTSVFEMGTGVTPALSLPRLFNLCLLMLFSCQRW